MNFRLLVHFLQLLDVNVPAGLGQQRGPLTAKQFEATFQAIASRHSLAEKLPWPVQSPPERLLFRQQCVQVCHRLGLTIQRSHLDDPTRCVELLLRLCRKLLETQYPMGDMVGLRRDVDRLCKDLSAAETRHRELMSLLRVALPPLIPLDEHLWHGAFETPREWKAADVRLRMLLSKLQIPSFH